MSITPRIGMGTTTSMIPKTTKIIRDFVLMLIAWAFLVVFIVTYKILNLTLLSELSIRLTEFNKFLWALSRHMAAEKGHLFTGT